MVAEAGAGKSRLVYEFTHSHRLLGWLVLESASVSYGKATSYVPVIDLLKGYLTVQDRDLTASARTAPTRRPWPIRRRSCGSGAGSRARPA